ncbi:hypothetical protein PVK64_15665 [Aliivibrio sp. S4TY2]|uniref:hypothetical protein n=1 Tax=unclassified Aliivibrio TaxID=2645654 RepID=UPI0023784727|nr:MULTISPECIES: hypothetical protein [unclassified Aliivibrio]MDD9157609.1 hypothetical protein [Aliivibrio sp. S4TY2]MDD9161428.1 hypothetical protein [Aliivibrio sp. S4TY1]MDD9165519.1 hypothetical protein [Aliivibrio sp. S4MY2]MDD9169457.1 hypothetical protein [Aliivibrio sp. S4MY4]MDD9186450.1 hypothetical protein [Aliivibrio sp. S4MY3]
MKKRIHSAYKGEIYGISFFTYFADNYTDKKSHPLWLALTQVERATADLLEISLHKLQIPFERHDPLMIDKGIIDAKRWLTLPWNELVDTLTDWVKPYEKKYREWALEAEDHTEVFQLIADHETAIYQCWKAEQNGEPGIGYLSTFIQKYT